MKTYEILIDTNTIEKNTADSVAIKEFEEIKGQTSFTTDKGDSITGTDITIKKFNGYKNLGGLKIRLEEINNLLISLPIEKTQIETEITTLGTEVETAIVNKLKEVGTVDNR